MSADSAATRALMTSTAIPVKNLAEEHAGFISKRDVLRLIPVSPVTLLDMVPLRLFPGPARHR